MMDRPWTARPSRQEFSPVGLLSLWPHPLRPASSSHLRGKSVRVSHPAKERARSLPESFCSPRPAPLRRPNFPPHLFRPRLSVRYPKTEQRFVAPRGGEALWSCSVRQPQPRIPRWNFLLPFSLPFDAGARARPICSACHRRTILPSVWLRRYRRNVPLPRADVHTPDRSRPSSLSSEAGGWKLQRVRQDVRFRRVSLVRPGPPPVRLGPPFLWLGPPRVRQRPPLVQPGPPPVRLLDVQAGA